VIAAIGKWVISVSCAAILCGAALSLTPKGRVYPVLRFVCGVVMVVVLVSPLREIDLTALSLNTERYSLEYEAIEANTKNAAEIYGRSIIESECAAYILDKAQVIGLSIESVSVTAKRGDDGNYYPYEAVITLPIGEKASGNTGKSVEKGALREVVEAELGIPPERQYYYGG